MKRWEKQPSIRLLMRAFFAVSSTGLALSRGFAQAPDSSSHPLSLIEKYQETSYSDSEIGRLESFFKTGGKSETTSYSSAKGQIKDGVHQKWYQNGQLSSSASYACGVIEYLTQFYPNGINKREEVFKNGKRKEGHCFDSLGLEVPFFNRETRASFPGGRKKYLAFLSRQSNYPEDLKGSGQVGIVKALFTVEKDGSLSDIKLESKSDSRFMEVVAQFMTLMPPWEPATQEGVPYKSRIPIIIFFDEHRSY